MAVGLTKSVVTPLTGSGKGPSCPPDIDGFRKSIAGRVFDAYCAVDAYAALVSDAVVRFSVERRTAELAVDMELEALSAVNETALLRETDTMLRQFTDRDRRLDEKTRLDVIQMVCRPKPGYAKGLKHDIAESHITAFCRQNGVKVKAGLFHWAVP